ncbi:MAG: type I phosphomannose isomerase catalytic subunit [Rikenellaceae bacterium]
MLYPLKFLPTTQPRLWGSESWMLSGVGGCESLVESGALKGRTISDIVSTYGAELVGHANYERFGNEFPLLIKFIDAKEDLSIQVHPNDELAGVRHNSKGKNEMWYLVGVSDDARIRSGFSRQVTPEEYIQSVADDTVCDILQEYEAQKGDLFFLPAGRIHSIGGGCLIAEIQQTSDITYRIYDFNRRDKEGNLRELHTELAVDAIDYAIEDDYRTEYDREAKDKEVKMVDCPYFRTSILNLTQHYVVDYCQLDSFVIYVCVEGECEVNGVELKFGETILLPATMEQVEIETKGCKLLTTHI